jgi:hypothetical protein
LRHAVVRPGRCWGKKMGLQSQAVVVGLLVGVEGVR